MAISPWHVASHLSCQDLADLLTGFDISIAKSGCVGDHEIKESEEWMRLIIDSVFRGELQPAEMEVFEAIFDTNPLSGEKVFLGNDWVLHDVDKLDFGSLELKKSKIRMNFRRQEVVRWLKTAGVDEKDIPEALRVKPKGKDRNDQGKDNIHPRRRKTYLTLIEALLAEVMGGDIPDEPYKAAAIVQAILERQGLSLDKDPIANTIKEIQEEREGRD